MKKFILGAAAAAVLALPAFASAHDAVRQDDPTGTFNSSTHNGYVAAGEHGVVACNASDADGKPVGYIWVGPERRADNPNYEAPGGEIGAGNNTREDDPTTEDVDESHGPCEDK